MLLFDANLVSFGALFSDALSLEVDARTSESPSGVRSPLSPNCVERAGPSMPHV